MEVLFYHMISRKQALSIHKDPLHITILKQKQLRECQKIDAIRNLILVDAYK